MWDASFSPFWLPSGLLLAFFWLPSTNPQMDVYWLFQNTSKALMIPNGIFCMAVIVTHKCKSCKLGRKASVPKYRYAGTALQRGSCTPS